MQVSQRTRTAALAASAGLLIAGFGLGAWQSLSVDGRLPRLALSYNWWMKELAAKGDLERVIEQRRIAAAIDHNSSVPALQGLAAALQQAGRSEEAIEAFERVLALIPNSVDTLNNYAAALSGLGRHSAAIAHLERAFELEPDSELLRENLEVLVRHRRELAHTRLAQLRAALEESPGSVPIANELAWILATHPDADIRQPDEAIGFAMTATQTGGDRDASVLDTLACSYAAVGRFAEALSTGRAALALAIQGNDADLTAELRSHVAGFERGLPVIDSS